MTQAFRSPQSSKYLPLLLLLFAGSGCSALIYETVWYQMLQLAIGSTAVSLGFLLATFMGGLCIGSLLLPRTQVRRHASAARSMRILELGIAVCAVLVHFYLPLVNLRLHRGRGARHAGRCCCAAFIAAVCLLPPTILMGASLPAIVRWMKSTPHGVSWCGLLYGGNTAGAVFGCLLAGFYLLRLYNMAIATYVAAAINVAVALGSFALAARTPAEASAPEPRKRAAADRVPRTTGCRAGRSTSPSASPAPPRWAPKWSGRGCSAMLLGLTVYIFSIILAVFLIGLAIGSAHRLA